MAGLIKRLTSAGLRCSTRELMMVKQHIQVERSSFACSFYRSSHVHCCSSSRMYSRSELSTFSSQRKYTSNSKVVPFKLSDIGEGIREVTIKEWFVNVGDKVSQFDNICEVQSDKASVTITSRYDGIITKLHYNIEDIALVGDPLVDLEVFDNSVSHTDKTFSGERTPDNVESCVKILATPAVRRLASEEKVDLRNVCGTGRHGRVLKEDVLAYLDGIKRSNVQTERMSKVVKESKSVVSNELSVTTASEGQMRPIQGFAKAMVKTMTAANMMPHFVYSDEINVTKMTNIIKELKQYKTDVKFTYMPFFIKAISKCLVKFPILNSSVDENCENILYKENHNIGIAMDTPAGLVVPNIKNVQKLNIRDVAMELLRLQNSGLKGTLGPSDLTGGTFTLSNIGTIGGTYTKPVILPPEVAIGAVGTLQTVPRYDEMSNIVETKVMCISWAADHRIIDGATMARFSNMWKHYIESPYLLFLDL